MPLTKYRHLTAEELLTHVSTLETTTPLEQELTLRLQLALHELNNATIELAHTDVVELAATP